ncbi:MAG TPA: CGNR zinc finger domain-containing protein [Galbitalea sp.]
MHFAPDVEETLEFAATLLNTAPGASRTGRDELETIEELHQLLDANRYGGRRERTESERRSVVETRDQLRSLWPVDREVLVRGINDILRASDALPQLVRHDEFDWHIHATPMDAPLAERIRVEVALALVDIVRASATDRLRVCAAHDCDGVLVDFSRNGSKRFCTVRCGNRMNMIAYRERQLSA